MHGKIHSVIFILRSVVIIKLYKTHARAVLTFLLGGFLYGATEILWRGYTHPAMLILGGFCLSVIYSLEGKLATRSPIFARSLCYAFIITSAAFVSGVVLNLILGMDIWDYSGLPLNILGQVCPTFFFVWFLLSFFCCFLCRAIRFAFS